MQGTPGRGLCFWRPLGTGKLLLLHLTSRQCDKRSLLMLWTGNAVGQVGCWGGRCPRWQGESWPQRDIGLRGGGDVPASDKRFPSLTLLLNLNLKVNEQSWRHRSGMRLTSAMPCGELGPQHRVPFPPFFSCLPFTPFQSHQSAWGSARPPTPPTLLGAREMPYRRLQRAVPLSDGLLPATAASPLLVSRASACCQLGGTGSHMLKALAPIKPTLCARRHVSHR